jgi:mannose/fructose/N-acetylgalactosamine-specific phosphotransferase system component IIC
MTPLVIVGSLAAVFGAAHVVFGRHMYAYYRRHFLLKYLSLSTEGAMRVHGAILTAVGIAVLVRALVSR